MEVFTQYGGRINSVILILVLLLLTDISRRSARNLFKLAALAVLLAALGVNFFLENKWAGYVLFAVGAVLSIVGYVQGWKKKSE